MIILIRKGMYIGKKGMEQITRDRKCEIHHTFIFIALTNKLQLKYKQRICE